MVKTSDILVATPRLEQTIFCQSVILITEHHSRGTVGIKLNHTSPDLTLQWIFHNKGIDYSGHNNTVYDGGPLNKNSLIMLHTDDWYSSNTMAVGRGLSISSDELMMDKIAMQNVPLRFRCFTGYSGWAPGQLAREIDQSRWLTCTLDTEEIFSTTGPTMWSKAIDTCASQTIDKYL